SRRSIRTEPPWRGRPPRRGAAPLASEAHRRRAAPAGRRRSISWHGRSCRLLHHDRARHTLAFAGAVVRAEEVVRGGGVGAEDGGVALVLLEAPEDSLGG